MKKRSFEEYAMDIFQLRLLGVPAALTVAKLAILALAVVYATRGILDPIGQARSSGSTAPSPVRLRSPLTH